MPVLDADQLAAWYRSKGHTPNIPGVQGSVRIDHGVWLRQHGVDGLAVIHATGSALVMAHPFL